MFPSHDPGIGGVITNTPLDYRPPALAFAFGRVFYILSSTLYFSPLLESFANIGDCFQEADPTSEHITDIIDTDGGTIQLPEAGVLSSIKTVGDSLVVGSNQGVWQIKAAEGENFTATNFRK